MPNAYKYFFEVLIQYDYGFYKAGTRKQTPCICKFTIILFVGIKKVATEKNKRNSGFYLIPILNKIFHLKTRQTQFLQWMGHFFYCNSLFHFTSHLLCQHISGLFRIILKKACTLLLYKALYLYPICNKKISV